MTHRPLNVAIPWSLSHYIPLNGFHPLYRALFDHAPDTVNLHAWDNVRLYRRFRSNPAMRNKLVSMAKERAHQAACLAHGSLSARHQEGFWPPNQVLTTELPGDIEFHHTALFPSLKRPFVFHCELFGPQLFPGAHEKCADVDQCKEIREYYRGMLESPLCLGVWSHIPETLKAVSRFFASTIIDRKLYPSRIGLSDSALLNATPPEKPSLSRPRFVFANSANQNPVNFFLRGGHIVLRFWKEFLADGRKGLLVLRCARPSDEDLLQYGVDLSMLRMETGRSIVWGQDYLANHEMNAVMANAHFLLLPSVTLHSVSIMQAMLLGTIPVVTDTVGTSVYVTDHKTGIVLNGVRAALSGTGPEAGILEKRYYRTPEMDDFLVSQLMDRVAALLDVSDAYQRMRVQAWAYAQAEFSGQTFSQHFWQAVSDLYWSDTGGSGRSDAGLTQVGLALSDCCVQGDDRRWARVFESPTQPMPRINTGLGAVWELGGAMIQAHGHPRLELNDWSVLGQYCKPGAPQTTFAYRLEELEGAYLRPAETFAGPATFPLHLRIFRRLEKASHNTVQQIARLLKPFPGLYRFASQVLSTMRRGRQWVVSRIWRPKTEPDVELIRQGVCGYNILRCQDRYYAIPQCEGEFIPAKADTGGYSSCFSDHSVEKVLELVAKSGASGARSSLVVNAWSDVGSLDSEVDGPVPRAGSVESPNLSRK